MWPERLRHVLLFERRQRPRELNTLEVVLTREVPTNRHAPHGLDPWPLPTNNPAQRSAQQRSAQGNPQQRNPQQSAQTYPAQESYPQEFIPPSLPRLVFKYRAAPSRVQISRCRLALTFGLVYAAFSSFRLLYAARVCASCSGG